MKGQHTRAQYVDAAVLLFQRDGYHGVGLSKLIAESGAPKGSFYFHFPGGKEELALAAIAKSDADVQILIEGAAHAAPDAPTFVRYLGKGLKQWLIASNFSAGCPVGTMTLELGASMPLIAESCRLAYHSWTRMIADAFDRYALPSDTVAAKATALVAMLEGAVILCRAEKSSKGIDDCVSVFVALLEV